MSLSHPTCPTRSSNASYSQFQSSLFSLICCTAAGFGFAGWMMPALIAATLVFLRVFNSPSGQRWQYPQLAPLWQPRGFQNQAQGLHLPVPSCSIEPALGSGPVEGPPTFVGEGTNCLPSLEVATVVWAVTVTV